MDSIDCKFYITKNFNIIQADPKLGKLGLRRGVRDFRAGDLYTLHPRMVPYLQQTGFYGISRIGFIPLNEGLITALVERWRPETHTFHLPDGECTITLQDVEIITGLPIDGDAITGYISVDDWYSLCQELLGAYPEDGELEGNFLKSSYLMRNCSSFTDDADEEVVIQHTRATILKLLCGVLIPNKSNDNVYLHFLPFLRDFQQCARFSWGGAVLAVV